MTEINDATSVITLLIEYSLNSEYIFIGLFDLMQMVDSVLEKWKASMLRRIIPKSPTIVDGKTIRPVNIIPLSLWTIYKYPDRKPNRIPKVHTIIGTNTKPTIEVPNRNISMYGKTAERTESLKIKFKLSDFLMVKKSANIFEDKSK